MKQPASGRKLRRVHVLSLMAVVALCVGIFWPRKDPLPPPVRRGPVAKGPTSVPAASRPVPRKKAPLTPAQRRLRKLVLREKLFSGEFALRHFAKKYRKLVEYKIREFQVDCELEQRCVKEELVQALKRAGPSLKQVRAMLKKAKVPPILLYLNFAESLWEADVRSRAGAYGVCQFMRSTAKWLGLRLRGPFSYFKDRSQRVLVKNKKGKISFGWKKKIDVYSDVYLYDQRRDVFTAIAMKIEYLQALKRRYIGDSWILAAFRYNFGPGNVAKIMARVKGRFARLPRRKRTTSRLIWMFLRSNRSQENYHYVANIMAFAHILSGLEVDHPKWVVPKPLVAVPFQTPIVSKVVRMKRGETVSKIASRHKVSVRAVLKATGISVAKAGRLPVGAKIKVPVARPLFLTPMMVRKHLGVGMEFYDWNPGIHDPRTRVKKVNYTYKFLYKVRPKESFVSIAKRFKHRRVRLRRLLRDNLTTSAYRKMLRKRKSKWQVQAGTLLKVKGTMRHSRHKSHTSVASPKERRKVERTMPPIPGGWVLYVPPHLAKRLQSFLKATIQRYAL